jgi:hypothetical protein
MMMMVLMKKLADLKEACAVDPSLLAADCWLSLVSASRPPEASRCARLEA